MTALTVADEAGEIVSQTRTGTNPGTTTTLSETTTFNYGPFGQLSDVTAPSGTTSYLYDKKRRVVAIDRYPNVRSYEYDSFDNVVAEHHLPDSRVQGVSPTSDLTFGRDLAGRPLSTSTGTFTWDTAANGFWKLASTTSVDGVSTTHTYNAEPAPRHRDLDDWDRELRLQSYLRFEGKAGHADLSAGRVLRAVEGQIQLQSVYRAYRQSRRCGDEQGPVASRDQERGRSGPRRDHERRRSQAQHAVLRRGAAAVQLHISERHDHGVDRTAPVLAGRKPQEPEDNAGRGRHL